MAVAVSLAACAADPAYQQPAFSFARGYAGQDRAAPVLLSNAAWWRGFRDPALDALIAQALAGNLSLEAARERVTEARATSSGISPNASVGVDASANATGANGQRGQDVATANLTFSWLLDPLGARRADLRAAGARVEVADAQVSAAQLLVVFNLANAYVDLRYSQRLLALRQQDLASRRKTLALTETFFAADSATRLDIVRSQAVVSDIEGQLPGLRASVQTGAMQIAVLTGVAPGQLAIDLNGGSGQPRPRLSADVGIPTDLLRNRPDIRVAERLYYAAVADITSARSDLYPKLSLGGAITLRAVGKATGSEFVFGPSLSLPPLLSNAPRAAVDVRESRARQAHIAWKSTVLTAVQEVEGALVTYSASRSAVGSAEKTVRLYGEVVSLTRELIERDGATLSDLIDAETSIASANVTLADSLRQQARSYVALNTNLGSGNAYKNSAN